jgi:serine phosphatase RsbU (regulator of sigma subunit)
MPVFDVTSRTVGAPGPPKKRRSRAWQRWHVIQIYVRAVAIVGLVFGFVVLRLIPSTVAFILLPVGLSVAISIVVGQVRLANRKAIVITACVALVYFSALTGFELLTHKPSTAEIVVVTTTLALAIMFEPVRNWVLRLLVRRFHALDDANTAAVEAFTAALREEIDLGQVRARFLDVVQKILAPQSVSLWIRTAGEDASAQSESAGGAPGWIGPALAQAQVAVDDHDPLLTFILEHTSAIELDRLDLDSPVLRMLKGYAVEIALPLASQGELLGGLLLGPRLNGQYYTGEDRYLLNTLAAQVAPALRVAQLALAQQAEAREHERIEQELRTAQEIQRTFLPKEVPTLPGWQLVPYYQPAHEVGGDFYDFLPFEDGRLGLVIGDVTGKGIPAALVMTATRTMIRTAVQESAAPAEVFARVNDLLCADIPTGMFVTCFYALLDPATGRLQFANAGHEPPYRRDAGCVDELRATGMPLGLMSGMDYDEYEAGLAPGESLLFYSDGLVEAHSPERQMFGFPRLKALLEAQDGDADGAALIQSLLGALARFTGEGWEQEDDVTLVTLQRAAEASAA